LWYVCCQDWEEYLGQDKDPHTGKKLTHRSKQPPAPMDPDHPWYTMQRTGTLPPLLVSAVAPSASNQSSYGTRSRETRLSETDSPRIRMRTERAQHSHHYGGSHRAAALVDPELHLPMKVRMEAPHRISRRRSIELETRRKSIAETIEPSPEERAVATAEATKREGEEDSWAAACAVYDVLQEEKERREKRLRDTILAASRAAHAEKQGEVVAGAMARMAARFSNKKRRVDVA